MSTGTPALTRRSRLTRWLVLFVLALGLLVGALSVGSTTIALADVGLFVTGRGGEIGPTEAMILREVRLPRTLTAIAGGMALALSGLILQTLLRNPLAEPYILGASAGGGLAVAIVSLAAGSAWATWLNQTALGTGGIVGVAACGSLAVLALLLVVAPRVSLASLLLIGVMIGAVASALSGLLVYFAEASDIRTFLLWGFGDFSGTTLAQSVRFLVATMLLAGLCLFLRKPLDALLLGELGAARLGIHGNLFRWVGLLVTALLTSLVIAHCGPIGFVGIAVPHFCRGWFRTHLHGTLLPAVLLAGATLGLLADLVSRLPGYETTLPLNPLLALVGAPVVIWILIRQPQFRGGES